MKTIAFFVVIFGLMLMLTSCDEPYVPLVFRGEYTLIDIVPRGTAAETNMLPLNLKIEVANHELARHEPVSGAFLGAYIGRDATLRGLRDFEAQTGVNHAMFVHMMVLGEDYPLRWVLENIASAKAPFIVLKAPQELCFGETQLFEQLRGFAQEAGRFDVPVFVSLFPLVGEHGFLAGEYISFFRAARRVFEFYAPNVAMVWGFDAENLADSVRFYPGRDAVDWIHLTVYNDICGDGNFRDFFAYVNSFYLLYQRERPLAVSTGVSHYSAEGNTYFALQAAERIEYIFARLYDYPRIKAILLHSYNDLEGSGNKFRLHDVEAVMQAYRRVAAHERFIGFVDNLQGHGGGVRRANQVMRSPFRAFMVDAYFYVPLRALVYDVRLPQMYLERLEQESNERMINGEIFFSMIDIHRVTGADIFVDFQRQTLKLR